MWGRIFVRNIGKFLPLIQIIPPSLKYFSTPFLVSASCVSAAGNHGALSDSSHSYTIKESCNLVVNSTITLLTTTASKIEEVGENYKNSLSKLTSILEECILLNGWRDDLWDNVIAVRANVNTYKIELESLLLYMDSVNKIVESSIEASFNLENNYICKTLCEISNSTLSELERQKKEIDILEQKYLALQTQIAKFPVPES